MTSFRIRIAAFVLLLLPATGHAQLGGLKRKLGDQLSKAMTGESQASSAAPTFNDRVLEITDARLGQLVAGLRAEGVVTEREQRDQAAIDAKDAARQRRAEAYGECADPYTKELLRLTGVTMGLTLAAKREESKGGVSRATQDSLKSVMTRLTKIKGDIIAKCGEEPGDAPFAAMNDRESADPGEVGAKAAGLSSEQYAVLRERVAAYVQARDGRTGRYAFTANERAAVDRNASALAGVRKLLVGD